MPNNNKNSDRDYSVFDSMSTDELNKIIHDDFLLPDGEDSDTDAVLYILEVFEKRETDVLSENSSDTEKAWNRFENEYLPFYSTGKTLYGNNEPVNTIDIKETPLKKDVRAGRKPHRFIKAACTVAAVLALIFAGSVTAYAFGFNIWEAVGNWTKETFGFFSHEDTKNTNPCIALQSLLKENGVEVPLVPTWLPEGFTMESYRKENVDDVLNITAIFSNDEKKIYIHIIKSNLGVVTNFEKDNSNVYEYTVNNIIHYIMTNVKKEQSVWQNGEFTVTVFGDLNRDELLHLIDSVYNGG